MVEIDLPEQGIRRFVFPLNRTYVEQPLPAEATASPCAGGAASSCSKTGESEIDGIKTEIWTSRQLTAQRETRVWWDATRRLVLRAEYGDGTFMEAKRAADDAYEGRTVERWRVAYRLPGGRMFPAEALYDSALGMTIAEWTGDGGHRQLVNLRPGPVDSAKFEAPADFNRLDTPTAMSEAAGAAAKAAASQRLSRMGMPATAAAVPPPSPQQTAVIKPVVSAPTAPAVKPTAPEPARQAEAPAAGTPAAVAAPAAPAQTGPVEPVQANASAPPLPQPKPTEAAAEHAAAAAAALAAAKAAKSLSAKKPVTAKGKSAPGNSTVPNPSGIPTLGALPASAAGATAAARKSGSAKKGTTRSKKGRRKAR